MEGVCCHDGIPGLLQEVPEEISQVRALEGDVLIVLVRSLEARPLRRQGLSSAVRGRRE